MEEIKLIFEEEATLFLDELIEILYKNEYFIFENIQHFPSKKTPIQLQKYGSNYIFYKINPRTTWFIFFEHQNNNFFISKIINNHCEEAKWL